MLLKKFESKELTGTVLTVVRVLLGIFWLLQITWKFPPTFGCPNQGLCLWMDMEIKNPVFQPYADLVAAVIRPNVYLIGWVTTIIEEGVGVLLLLGLFTRFGAFVATMWSINLLIGLANIPGEQGWYYAFLIMLNLVFLAVGASGQLSVDRLRGWRSWWARAAQTIT